MGKNTPASQQVVPWPRRNIRVLSGLCCYSFLALTAPKGAAISVRGLKAQYGDHSQ